MTLFALALRVFGLTEQPLIGDDVAVGHTARNFVEFGWPGPTMWNHPRLRDLLVYASTGGLGEGPWGLKVWSVLLGTLAVPLTAGVVLGLSGGRAAALVAAAAVATDPLHLDFSRQAINDVYLSAFPVAAVVALLRYRDTLRPKWLALAGGALGLGLSSKWGAAIPVFAAAALILAGRVASTRGRERIAEVAAFAGCLVWLPLAIYAMTFWPWFGAGHDLEEFIALHRAMALETATHAGYGTKLPGFPGEVVGAWRWFVQPIWYVDYIPMGADGADGFFLSGVANPLVWLATLPATAWAGWRWLRERDSSAGWLLLLLAAAYLPFVIVPRPIWTNSAVTVLPFSAGIVGWAAARLDERLRAPVRTWAAAALALAVLLWPAATGTSAPRFEPILRSLVSPAALDPASHLRP